MTEETCAICQNECNYDNDSEFYYYDCESCGKFKIRKNSDLAKKIVSLFFDIDNSYERGIPSSEEGKRVWASLIYATHKITSAKQPQTTKDKKNYTLIDETILSDAKKFPLSLFEQIDEYILWAGNYLKYPKELTLHEKNNILFDGSVIFPYFGCYHFSNLLYLSKSLLNEKYTESLFCKIIDPESEFYLCTPDLTPKGWKRFYELQKTTTNSDQCFVAMWFNDKEDKENDKPNMQDVYHRAIGPAIKETNHEPKKIDLHQHNNDINDEMIAEIRKSKFMIADLTGYRGGVYWESGFAYGLGKPVIYTCHSKWRTPKEDANGNVREGVHFDLSHRNLILWNEDNLDDFKNRIKARIEATIL